MAKKKVTKATPKKKVVEKKKVVSKKAVKKVVPKKKELELPAVVLDRPLYQVQVVRRDDEETLTEIRNSGNSIGSVTIDDGQPGQEEDEVIVVVRK